MDLRQLTYFVAVAEMGHLGRAARRLHLSQPPLSRHIQAMEKELGADLFERRPQGMALTDAGQELLRHARSVLAQVDQAAVDTRRVARGERGVLDIGIYGSAIFGAIPRVLAAFRSRYPEVEVRLHQAQTPQQIDALRRGRVTLVFERLLPQEPDIDVMHVAQERLMLALQASHPLAARDVVDVGALADETLLVGTAPTAVAQVYELCRAHGFEPRLGATSTDVVTATLLASTGAGVTLVPESMAHVHFPGIAYRALAADTVAVMDLHCFYLRGNASPQLAAMLDTVRSMKRG